LHQRDYAKGLVEIADGCFSYMQPNGGWCLSNAGLMRGAGASLLIDTLTNVPLTRDMLDVMRPITDAAPIRTLAITHGNLDHYFGNQLVEGAEILATAATAEEMAHGPTPASMKAMVTADFGPEVSGFLRHAFGQFDWDGIDVTMPNRTFSGRLEVEVGGRQAELIEVGPAHTAGDTLCFLPEERVLYAGDILFVYGTPIVWAGPYANWTRACDLILGLDPAVIVPGHGPMSSQAREDMVLTRDYLAYLRKVMGEAARNMEPWEPAYQAADWSRFEHLPLFRVANRMNAYNTYLLMEREAN